jgi:DNA polymerase-3 subunit alpha
MAFVDLHLHGQYSLLDGLIRPAELMEKCKALGRTAVALTDHGTMGGLVEFHKAARSAGVKPILGMEAYHDRGDGKNYHLVLLARNRDGYTNLVKLNNESQGNIYKKPRVNDDMLRRSGSGLVCLTGCLQGYLPQTVLAGAPDWAWAREAALWFDAFYLEVQNHGIPEEAVILEAMMSTGMPVVGTTDAHFLNREDSLAHEVGLAVSMNKRAGEFRFPGAGYYVRHESEIDLPAAALERTAEVAALVEEYDLGYKVWQLPEVDYDPERELSLLGFKLDDYLVKRYGFDGADGMIKEYELRLEYEFKVISDNGFVPYFKIVADICEFVDGRGKLRGWGRGSAAGSLVAFLYGITKIDPVEWGLYFERFLNPDRISPPDIDLDFQPEDREPVMEYMRQKYGRVYQIGTYTTLGSKEVIRSCSKAMGVETSLEEYVPVEAPVPSVAELMRRDDAFAARVREERNEDFVRTCIALEGLPRNRSAHASGVVIDASGEVPYQVSKSGANAGLPVTSYDMYSLDELKLTKIDILGVNMLAIIDRACKASGVRVEDIPLDDQLAFDRFNDGQTMGVFQFETHSFAKIIRELHPDTFEELVDLNTLGRPGCLESGMTDEYIERKHGRRQRRPIHPKVRDTGHQGLPLFQEQMMEIAREVAGFTMAQADTLRKAIGKKQKDLFESLHRMFIDGCATTSGMPEDEAAQVWETIEKSARYTWNLSHAVAYTLISYWTMWLAANRPVEYFCELINGAGDAGRRRLLLSECAKRGIPVEHPLINEADREPTVRGGRILLGLSGIKYVGDSTLDSILAERAAGEFLDSADLKSRTKANKRHVEYLLKAGCFPAEHVPGREDELEALGYSISTKAITEGYLKYLRGVVEVIDVKAITTKKGDPMCFLTVETHDDVMSVTVFPRNYAQMKHALVPGAVLGLRLDGDILVGLFDPLDLERMRVYIPEDKADEFMSFCPSCPGEPNVMSGGLGISRVNMDGDMFAFIEQQFGVVALEA